MNTICSLGCHPDVDEAVERFDEVERQIDDDSISADTWRKSLAASLKVDAYYLGGFSELEMPDANEEVQRYWLIKQIDVQTEKVKELIAS